MNTSRTAETSQSPGRWRSRLIIGLMAAVGVALSLRLIQLQAIRRHEFGQQVSRQSTFRDTLPARPGDLIDRHGRLFATTVTTRSLYVVPQRIENRAEVARQIAEALKLEAATLERRIAEYSDKYFLWVKRRLSEDEVRRVRALKLPAEMWGFQDEFLRRYPQGALAAQVIGLRDVDGKGQGGLEQSLDPILRGRDGWRELIRDARGRVIDVADSATSPPRHGEAVVLTLDAVLQLYTERALSEMMTQWKPKSCCAVVLAPQTGEVLAMASLPTFDPNHPAEVEEAAWKNRTIADIYEPGSTFKPCVIAWALQMGCLEHDEVFNCEYGKYRMGRRLLHDHHPYGDLNVVDILVKSSNIGMAKIGERMTNEGLHAAATAFGFGRPTGIELPGELSGVLRPLEEWNSYSTGSVPMGHEIAATPLQLITAAAVLANGGRLITPHLVLKIGHREETPAPVVMSEVVRRDIAEWVTQHALTEVVRRGTGRRAAIPGYDVFGKTGTAQKTDPETGKYSNRLHMTSFLCGAPADDPQVLVLVCVDEPSAGGEHFGGTVAAPAARQILEKALVQLRVPQRDGTLRSALQRSTLQAQPAGR